MEDKRYWLWAFSSAENDTLVKIIDSRKKDVVKEIMGDNFHAPFIVHG